ncbi:hypothetical protein SAMN04488032_1208 [Pacificibacter marinus]|uniref:Uncharacterized protein n=1 Tax=Pacificibacter marinus TaxID=658057 RepID=A0A1Y5TPU6_9RHOB|nr:hypothetical protein SAMN04488032_1208 [Pacificibacter marinus]SLN69315.1 hypothetical protein PAM7971_03700 [Pacificibacter marinus]
MSGCGLKSGENHQISDICIYILATVFRKKGPRLSEAFPKTIARVIFRLTFRPNPNGLQTVPNRLRLHPHLQKCAVQFLQPDQAFYRQ